MPDRSRVPRRRRRRPRCWRWRAARRPCRSSRRCSSDVAAPARRAGGHLARRCATSGAAVDTAWRRTSYSGLIRAEEQRARCGSEPEHPGVERRGRPVDADGRARRAAGATTGAAPRRWTTCPPGATFGSLVHAVLEHADPQAADLAAELTRRVEEQRRVVVGRRDRRGAGRRAAADAAHPARPAGRRPDPGRDRPLRDRLCELDFEFPLAGGDVRDRRRRAPRATLAAAAAPAPARRRPAARRTPTGSRRRRWAASRCAATSAAPSTWCCASRAGRRRTGSSSSTTRPTGSASRARPLTARTTPRRSWPRRCCTPTTRCRRCSTPSCCTATCAGGCPTTTPSATSAGCSTSSCAACAGRRRRSSTASRAACSPGGRRPRWSRRLSDLLEPGATVTELLDDRRRPRPPPRPRAIGPAAHLQPGRRARGRRRARRRRGSARSSARPTTTVLARGRRSPCGPCGAGRSASTSPRSGRRSLRRRPPVAGPADGWLDRVAASCRGRALRGRARLDGTGCSTSTATGARRAGAATTCSPALPPPRPRVDPAALEPALTRLFPTRGYDEQRAAAARPRARGPPSSPAVPAPARPPPSRGLLALLAEQTGPAPARIALAAPTGKAAARLQEAVRPRRPGSTRTTGTGSGRSPPSTLHRLLGWRPDGTGSATTATTRCPHDVVVVDETSMVSLPLMARLLDAVRPDARLVLVGDPDQLASRRGRCGARRPRRPRPRRPRAHRLGRAPCAALAATASRPSAVGAASPPACGPGEADPGRAGPARRRRRPRQVPSWSAPTTPRAVEPSPRRPRPRCAGRRRAVPRARPPRGGRRPARPRRAGRGTGCCAPTAAAPTAWPVELARRATGSPRRPAAPPARRVVRRPSGAGHRQRLDQRRLQRRHRRHRPLPTTAGSGSRSRPGRRAPFAPSRLAGGRDRARDDHPQEPGLGVRRASCVILPPTEDSRLLTRELLYTAVTRARHGCAWSAARPPSGPPSGREVQRASGLGERLRERLTIPCRPTGHEPVTADG